MSDKKRQKPKKTTSPLPACEGTATSQDDRSALSHPDVEVNQPKRDNESTSKAAAADPPLPSSSRATPQDDNDGSPEKRFKMKTKESDNANIGASYDNVSASYNDVGDSYDERSSSDSEEDLPLTKRSSGSTAAGNAAATAAARKSLVARVAVTKQKYGKEILNKFEKYDYLYRVKMPRVLESVIAHQHLAAVQSLLEWPSQVFVVPLACYPNHPLVRRRLGYRVRYVGECKQPHQPCVSRCLPCGICCHMFTCNCNPQTKCYGWCRHLHVVNLNVVPRLATNQLALIQISKRRMQTQHYRAMCYSQTLHIQRKSCELFVVTPPTNLPPVSYQVRIKVTEYGRCISCAPHRRCPVCDICSHMFDCACSVSSNRKELCEHCHVVQMLLRKQLLFYPFFNYQPDSDGCCLVTWPEAAAFSGMIPVIVPLAGSSAGSSAESSAGSSAGTSALLSARRAAKPCACENCRQAALYTTPMITKVLLMMIFFDHHERSYGFELQQVIPQVGKRYMIKGARAQFHIVKQVYDNCNAHGPTVNPCVKCSLCHVCQFTFLCDCGKQQNLICEHKHVLQRYLIVNAGA